MSRRTWDLPASAERLQLLGERLEANGAPMLTTPDDEWTVA